MTQSAPLDWSICILSSRESTDVLAPVVRAAAANCRDKRAIVDVVINGNPQLASEMAQLVGNGCLRGQATHVRVWDIRCGDKANAWNVHLHTIYSGARVVFYIDGYAEVAPDALALMDEALSKQPGSLAITGVPSHGRAAPKMRATMIAEGGIHGNLFAIRGDVLGAMRANQFRLPLGLYRTDATIGAVLAFNLEPSGNTWDMGRILVHPDVTWKTALPRATLKAHLWRRVRQAQGRLENFAVRQAFSIERRDVNSLPAQVFDLIFDWVRQHPRQALLACVRHPLCVYALILLKRRGRIEPGEPLLVAEVSCKQTGESLTETSGY